MWTEYSWVAESQPESKKWCGEGNLKDETNTRDSILTDSRLGSRLDELQSGRVFVLNYPNVLVLVLSFLNFWNWAPPWLDGACLTAETRSPASVEGWPRHYQKKGVRVWGEAWGESSYLHSCPVTFQLPKAMSIPVSHSPGILASVLACFSRAEGLRDRRVVQAS